MFRRKDRPHQPSRAKLDLAINDVLDKAVNADSDKAPGQLRLLLIKEHPLWKLPEKRVARYLKRHLKARKDPVADDIDADMDEDTVYTTMSSNGNFDSLSLSNKYRSNQASSEDDDKVEENETPPPDTILPNSPDTTVPASPESVGSLVDRKNEVDGNCDDDVNVSGDFTDIKNVILEESESEVEEYEKEVKPEAYAEEKDDKVEGGLKCDGLSCVIS
mmetsp:Transcript_191/g.260  ORF Transcript_191/g.260 Transcript_191/m.260 type:complete len:218 (+) Transcript_191:71-724(+)